jgi:hypothetical protein
MTVDEYIALITPWHASRPKFVATVQLLLEPLVAIQEAINHLPENFDLEEAIGVQLDIVGKWVGQDRVVTIPPPAPWFAFDIPVRGFDLGIWRGPHQILGIPTSLDDDTYRRLLYAVISANHYDGSIPGIQRALDIFFTDPDSNIFVLDGGTAIHYPDWFSFDIVDQGFDQGRWRQPLEDARGAMFITVNVAGKIPSRLDLALLSGGYIPVKPGGIRVETYVTSIDETPLFGFDSDGNSIAGFDHGSWGISPEAVLEMPEA